MKAILEFNLPEERTEHLQAVNAGTAWSALYNLDNKMRGIVKHGHSFKTIEELAHYIRGEIAEATVDLQE